MKHFIGLLIIFFLFTVTGRAQSETELKQFFQGKTVTLRIDLPATKDGVNIYPERSQPFDYKEYGERLLRHGAFVRGYEVVTITQLDVKGKEIEVQSPAMERRRASRDSTFISIVSSRGC